MINDKRPIRPWAMTVPEAAVFIAVMASACLAGAALHYRTTGGDIRAASVSAHGVEVDSASGRLDLNTASESELLLLPGIGPRRAQTILQERTRRGAFRSVQDLCELPGFTKTLVQRLSSLLRAGPSTP